MKDGENRSGQNGIRMIKLYQIEIFGKLEKYSVFVVVALLVFSFILQLYSAAVMPFIVHYEVDKLEFIEHISFHPKHLQLPLGDEILENPLLSTYVLKLVVALLGKSKLGVRIIFVLFSIFGLVFIYKLVNKELQVQTAILSLLFLTTSQFYIGSSRAAGELSLVLFFVAASMYVYFQILNTHNVKYVYRLALLLGFGCLNYQVMVLLIAVFLLFLFIKKKYRFWFMRKELYYSGLIVLMLFSPYLYWCYSSGFNKLGKEHFFDFGFSLRSFYLYFGEILAWLTERVEFFTWGDPLHMGGAFTLIGSARHLRLDTSNEFPFIHWVLGLLIFTGYIYCVRKKDKDELIEFCLVMFAFVFISTSVIAGAYAVFDDHWWAGMTIFPGIILCSHMFIELHRKYYIVRFLIAGIIIYFLYHAVYFVSLPEHQYAVPKKDLYGYYLYRAQIYLEENNRRLAVSRCQWVLARTKDESIIKLAKDILFKAKSEQD